MTSVWKGRKPLPMGGYVTEEVIGGKVGKRRKKIVGVGIKAANPSSFTSAGVKAAHKRTFVKSPKGKARKKNWRGGF